MFHAKRPSSSKGVLAGLIAGAVGSWVMNGFQAALGKLQSAAQHAGQSEAGSSQGDAEEQEPANIKAAAAISKTVFRHELKSEQKSTAGSVVHYSFGAVVGAGYGLLVEYWPTLSSADGLLFGSLVWAAADETVVPLAGLSKPPQKYPVTTHASALAAHCVYGVTTEFVRRALRKGYLAH
jgi:uncharacterized membrane protein YagU involved in acid resistance